VVRLQLVCALICWAITQATAVLL